MPFRGGTPESVLLEVGTHSPWLSPLRAELGHEVIVANPGRVRLIAASATKHDRADAEHLARLGRIEPALLAPVRHRGLPAQRDLAVIRARDSLPAADQPRPSGRAHERWPEVTMHVGNLPSKEAADN